MFQTIFIAVIVAVAASIGSHISFQRVTASAELLKKAATIQLDYAAERPAREALQTASNATDALVVMNGKLMRVADNKRRYDSAIGWPLRY